MDIDVFVHALLILRVMYPFSVISWFRTRKRNLQVGGHPRSYHLCGLAVDIVLDDPDDLIGLRASVPHYGLELIESDGKLHLEPKGGEK